MEGQVDEQVKNERSAALLAVDERLREAYIKENSDKILEVLAEEIVEAGGQKYMVGHSKEYIKVGLEDCKIHENQVVSGKMTGDRRKDFVICERMD